MKNIFDVRLWNETPPFSPGDVCFRWYHTTYLGQQQRFIAAEKNPHEKIIHWFIAEKSGLQNANISAAHTDVQA